MDRKFSELGEHDLNDILDQEVFTPPPSDSNSSLDFELEGNMDHDWLDSFFDPVLNDRMMSEALQPPNVQSEHSYSLANSESGSSCDAPATGQISLLKTDIKTESVDHDMDTDFLVNPNTLQKTNTNTAPTTTLMVTTPMTTAPTTCLTRTIKQEPLDTEMTTVTVTRTNPHTLVKQPTIILATQTLQGTTTGTQLKQERLVLPKMNIKVEPVDFYSDSSSPEHITMYDHPGLPPTPPSSTSSDSEGGNSPQRSAPSSPHRHTPYTRQHHLRTTVSQPLFSSPIPTSGVLILSEEEKRTLISEGYPLPNKLPLTKQEEKNLKKIRRKIKNKISAQESRRKKKEYMESLEKRMEGYSQENSDLKKKLEQLETNNRSLMSQLQKLQSLVGKVARPAVPTTQTGTCLMVLVLFFAVFLGTWSPMSLNVGYGSTTATPGQPMGPAMLSKHSPVGVSPMIPEAKDAREADAYSTANMRSRVLLSMKEECDEDEAYGPHAPFSYQDLFSRWFSYGAEPKQEEPADYLMAPPLPKVDMLDVESENNQTGDDRRPSEPVTMRPDIAADISTMPTAE